MVPITGIKQHFYLAKKGKSIVKWSGQSGGSHEYNINNMSPKGGSRYLLCHL